MIYGISAGILWALDTVILGIAMSKSIFISNESAIILAPFISAFLHDFFSAVWATIYNLLHKNLNNVFNTLKTKDGLYIMLAALIGGPVGMTGYIMSINYLGASIGAVASAIFPAIGTVLAYFFLKEKVKWYQWIFLFISLIGVYGVSYSPELNIKNMGLGILGTFMCAFGWGIEAVILAKSMKNPNVKNEYALQIRQTTSAIIHGTVILPIVKGWNFTGKLIINNNDLVILIILLAAFCGTFSYLCYYRAISKLGASKAMALNITYAAWSIVFTVIILHDKSVLTPITIISATIVLVFGILAATNINDLFKKKK